MLKDSTDIYGSGLSDSHVNKPLGHKEIHGLWPCLPKCTLGPNKKGCHEQTNRRMESILWMESEFWPTLWLFDRWLTWNFKYLDNGFYDGSDDYDEGLTIISQIQCGGVSFRLLLGPLHPLIVNFWWARWLSWSYVLILMVPWYRTVVSDSRWLVYIAVLLFLLFRNLCAFVFKPFQNKCLKTSSSPYILVVFHCQQQIYRVLWVIFNNLIQNKISHYWK